MTVFSCDTCDMNIRLESSVFAPEASEEGVKFSVSMGKNLL